MNAARPGEPRNGMAINIAPFFSHPTGVDSLNLAPEIGSFCERDGAFCVRGHSSEDTTANAVIILKNFFALSPEIKRAVSRQFPDRARGYAAVSDRDIKEPYQMFNFYRPCDANEMEQSASGVLMGPNRWPELRGFRENLEMAGDSAQTLAGAVARALDLALWSRLRGDMVDLEPEEIVLFRQFLPSSFWGMHATENHPTTHDQFAEGLGLFTVVVASTDPLQVQTREGQEWKVLNPPADGALIVLGRMAEVLTNGLWKSATYRGELGRDPGRRLSLTRSIHPHLGSK